MLRAVFAHVFCLAHFTIDEKRTKEENTTIHHKPWCQNWPNKKKKGVNNLGVCVCVFELLRTTGKCMP